MIDVEQCSACSEIKTIGNFSTTGHRLRSVCKPCRSSEQRRRYHTKEGKEQDREKVKRWRASKKGIEYRKKYGQYWSKKQQKEKPEVIKAHTVVYGLIKQGVLARPDTKLCVVCGATGNVYHHHCGYNGEHRADVVPVCRLCHSLVHGQTLQLS